MTVRLVLLMLMASIVDSSLHAREIVLGIEPVPIKKMALMFTPIVLPDLISAKAAFEYRLSNKFNLVLPIEAKWMDYRKGIKFFAKTFKAERQDLPEFLYREDARVKPLWNIDMAQFKISTGIGAKYFPFSESMTNAFFVKSLILGGFERFNAYQVEGLQNSAVFTHVFTVGYSWVKLNRFTFGFEIGEEYTLHTNPIKGLPILIDGMMPIFQMSLGFTI